MHFRYVVFHPFLDEILVGKIKYCSQEGVHGNILSFDPCVVSFQSCVQIIGSCLLEKKLRTICCKTSFMYFSGYSVYNDEFENIPLKVIV